MNALGFLRDPDRSTVMHLKGHVARVLTHPLVGRAIGAAGGGMVRSHGIRIDTRSSAVSPRTRAMLRLGIYEGAEVRLVRKHLRPTPALVDLGASLGVLSCVSSQLLAPGARLVAVEANPDLLPCLRANLNQHAPLLDRVIEHGAVDYFHAPGADVLFGRGLDHAGAARADTAEDGFTAPAVRLSDVLSKHEIGEYTLLCDIEGAEVDILLSDRDALAACTEMVIELHDTTRPNGSSYLRTDLAGLIRELGFVEVAAYGSVHVFRRPGAAENRPTYAVVTTASAELSHLADGLGRRHRLAAYGHSIVTPRDLRAPRLLPSRFEAKISGRVAPLHIPPARQHSLAPIEEMLRSALPRPLADSAKSLSYARSVRMSRAAVDLSGEVLVVSHAAAREAFTQTGHRLRVLNMPTVHPAFRNRTILEEAERFPALANTMFGNIVPNRQFDRLREELDLADVVLAGSRFAAGTLIAEGVAAAKVVVSPYGVAAVDLPRRLPSDGLRVLFAGRLTQAKGLAYLLEGYRSAARPDWSLRVIGRPQGSTEGFPGIGDWWVPSAPVPRGQMSGIFSNADVLVLPTLFEGLPLTVLEAMSHGLPVITTPTGADEVVDDGVEGFLVAPHDSAAIADRLEALDRDPGVRRRMGEAAIRRAREYSWEAYVERTVNAVDEAWKARSAQ
ncbi:FkbM family methyltransferase [Nocardioides sp. HB32]